MAFTDFDDSLVGITLEVTERLFTSRKDEVKVSEHLSLVTGAVVVV